MVEPADIQATPVYEDLQMETNIHEIPGSHIPLDFQIPTLVKMTGGPITLESNRSSTSPNSQVKQGSSSTSTPPHPQGLLPCPGPSASQETAKNPKRQKKGRVFTETQNLVLQEHFAKHKYLKKDDCTAIAERIGIDEHHIKIWFKNRRAREKQKKDREVPVSPAFQSQETYPGPVQDSFLPKTAEHISHSKTDPEASTQATGREWETQSPDVILANDNDRDSSAIQDQLFLQQLCELEDSLVDLSTPDFFENFSLLDFF